MSTTQSELRLASLLDERETVTKLHETVVASVATNEGQLPTESQAQQIQAYREKEIALDEEIGLLTEDVERNRRAVESSKAIRRVLAGGQDGVEADEDGVSYRTMAAYARDVILTRESTECAKIAAQFGSAEAVRAASERLQLAKRTPADTLSSDVDGLIPPQHIAQIFQVIDTSRPIVASAQRADLVRGQLTYPKITQRPVVAVQASEKTEAGNQKMIADMLTSDASVYLGGGDLSWQAINWSTPSALELWFQLAAADYALKTEQDAATELTHSAHFHSISTRFGASGTFAEFMTAVGAGAAAVYAASGRMANTVYMAADRYWYIFGLTSTATAQFTNVANGEVGPLTFIPSRGMDTGEIIVGDRNGLLVAETPEAPVDLRVVEPAIGGVEVGIIGGFEAVVVDDGAFSLITAAS